MKHLRTFLAAIGVVALAGLVMAQSPAQPALVKLPNELVQNASRPCLYQSGGWGTIDSDSGAAANNNPAAFNAWSTYVIQCDDDAYIAWGAAAVDADTSDGWIAGGAWIRFLTDGTNLYVGVQNKTDATADCHYIECK